VVQTPVDTVAFRSTPVAADTILTGDIHLDLSLTSLSPRYQVNPDFYDVSPDGTAKRIYWLPSVSIGPIIPFAVMDGVPGQDRHLSWDPETTFFVVRAGHRIELRISTAQREGLLPEPAPGGYFVNHAGAKQSTLTFSALPLAQLDWSNHNCPAS
jgi:predicted acyl esterase